MATPSEEKVPGETLFAQKVRAAASKKVLAEEQEKRDKEARRKARLIMQNYGLAKADRAFSELDQVSDSIEDYELVRKHMSNIHWDMKMADEAAMERREYTRKVFGESAAELMEKARRRVSGPAEGLDMWQGVAAPDINPSLKDEKGNLTGHGRSVLKAWQTWFDAEYGTEGVPDVNPRFQVRE